MTVSACVERMLDEHAFPIGNGVFIAVTGPSGAGKDSLIDFARRHFAEHAEIGFVRRVVTRESDPDAEDHDVMDGAAFEQARAKGGFAVSWLAHGHGYGLPAVVDEEVRAGRVMIANVSRGVLTELAARYDNVVVVTVTAPEAVLAERLAARNRASDGDVAARVARQVPVPPSFKSVEIDNGGRLDDAGRRFITVIERALALAGVSGVV